MYSQVSDFFFYNLPSAFMHQTVGNQSNRTVRLMSPASKNTTWGLNVTKSNNFDRLVCTAYDLGRDYLIVNLPLC